MKVKNDPSEGPCSDFETLVGPFVDGELPVGEVTRLEDHLDDCDPCRTLAEQLRSFDDLARSSLAQPPPVSAEEWGSMWANIQSDSTATRRPIQGPSRRWIVRSVAAAALLLFGVFVALQVMNVSSEEVQEARIIGENDFEGEVDNSDPEVPVFDFTKG